MNFIRGKAMYYQKNAKHYKYVLRILFIAIVVLFILTVAGCEKGDTDTEGRDAKRYRKCGIYTAENTCGYRKD